MDFKPAEQNEFRLGAGSGAARPRKEDPKGYGAIEDARALMARAAGITISEGRLLEENGRRHFMTRRFDRLEGGAKPPPVAVIRPPRD